MDTLSQLVSSEPITKILQTETDQSGRLMSTLIMLYPVIASLGIGTSVIAVIYYIGDIIIKKIRSMLICSITIQHTDEVYKWVVKYIVDKNLIESNNQMRVKVKQSNLPWWEEIFQVNDSQKKPELDYLPGPGNHIFKYKGYTLWTQFNEGQTQVVGWERIPEKEQDITIYSYSRNIDIIRDFIDQCVENSLERNNGKISIYEQHRWGLGWTKAQTKRPRTLESVILDRNISDDLCKEIEEFLSLEQAEWYKNKGIPYRRGYLLYGPPGSGKTSFTEAIAGQCKLNLCYLNLSGGTVDDDGLNRLLTATPSRSIILLEDIDSIFVKRQSVGKGKQRGVSFSGLLNALDGVRAQEGRIVFMTTNHKENLDPALLRPGRADVHILLNNASSSQIQRVFLKFFNGETQKAQEFSEKLPEFKVSMAKLQGHLLKYRRNIDECIKNTHELTKEISQNGDMSVSVWLNRLNMQQLIPQFYENKVYNISELKNFTDIEKVKEQFKIEDQTMLNRYDNHVNSNDNGRQDYQYLTQHQAKSIIMNYIKNQQYVKELATMINDDQMTGFQLKDILNQQIGYQQIKQKIHKQLEMNDRINKGDIGEYLFEIQSENEQMKRKSDIEKEEIETLKQDVDYDLEQLFEQCGQNQYIRQEKEKKKDDQNQDDKDKEQLIYPKEIIEQQMISNIHFWSLTESELESVLKIKAYGVKKSLLRMMEKIKKDHQDKVEENYRQKLRAEKEQNRIMLQKMN